jgi:hypothetical protein
VPPGLVARAGAAGITAWRTYGSTEHPAISSGGPDDPPLKRRLTDGRVAPGNEVRLVDESGSDVAPGAEGEIVARGPRQFVGYRDPALNADAYLDGTWFRTGDLARFDPDGYLVVTDRVKDIIIRGGENISAREVEEALAGGTGIREIAVCAAPDQTWGEVVCAVVVPGRRCRRWNPCGSGALRPAWPGTSCRPDSWSSARCRAQPRGRYGRRTCGTCSRGPPTAASRAGFGLAAPDDPPPPTARPAADPISALRQRVYRTAT